MKAVTISEFRADIKGTKEVSQIYHQGELIGIYVPVDSSDKIKPPKRNYKPGIKIGNPNWSK